MTTAGRTSACKGDGCGALIRWLFTENGRRMPLDVDPHPDGTVVLVQVDGKTLARVLTGAQLPAQETAYRPHWATCPASDAMRAKKARAAARGPLCGRCGHPMDTALAEREGWREHPACDSAEDSAHKAAVAARRRRRAGAA
jgi:hypothetical protein